LQKVCLFEAWVVSGRFRGSGVVDGVNEMCTGPGRKMSSLKAPASCSQEIIDPKGVGMDIALEFWQKKKHKSELGPV
jgi:hypothetical protein